MDIKVLNPATKFLYKQTYEHSIIGKKNSNQKIRKAEKGDKIKNTFMLLSFAVQKVIVHLDFFSLEGGETISTNGLFLI